jgi:hypothetical protein
MNKKPTLLFTTTIVTMLSIMSCTTSTLTSAPSSEPPIPSNFTTYKSDGLFSISYPTEWVPATSIMDELLEDTISRMKADDPKLVLENVSMLFLCGIENKGGYSPSVSIVIDSRNGQTLEEYDEATRRYSMKSTQGYHEYSSIKTVVDKRQAIISDTEDNEPEYGVWRYIQLVTVKDEFVWIVTCGSKGIDFQTYESEFYSIVRSLQVLN